MAPLRVLRIIGLPLVALLLVASAASAQATLDLAIEQLDASMDVQVGEPAHTMTFTVTLTGQGFVCSAASSFPIALSVEGADPDAGFNASVSPESLSIPVAQGAYVEPPLQPYSGEADGRFEVGLGNNIPKNHGPHTFTVKASWTDTPPMDCQATQWTINEASQAHAVNPIYPEVETPPTGGGAPSGTDGEDGGGDSEEGAGVGPMFVIGLGAVALARLRRH